MISGAHTVIYSTNPEADRAFLQDMLELTNVDVGGGWLKAKDSVQYGWATAHFAIGSDNKERIPIILMGLTTKRSHIA